VLTGTINVQESGMATVDNKQIINNNTVFILSTAQSPLDNTVSVGELVLQGATGNVGLNIAAGDNNAQDNAGAISAIATALAGSADAENFSIQKSLNNVLETTGPVDNNVSILG